MNKSRSAIRQFPIIFVSGTAIAGLILGLLIGAGTSGDDQVRARQATQIANLRDEVNLSHHQKAALRKKIADKERLAGIWEDVAKAKGASPSKAPVKTGPQPEAPAAAPQNAGGVESEALLQMETVFEGAPSQATIRARLNKAFRLYDLPVTEENYSRAGSSLVALSNEMGVAEMEILDAAIQLHVPGVNLSLPDAFGLAAAEIALNP